MRTSMTAAISTPQHPPKLRHAIGPGILMAAAAIGGSHLVASTQAGALYGWGLLGLLLAVNLLKYPFFEFGMRYTAYSQKTLPHGYRQMGKAWLSLFTALVVFSGVVNIAALTGLTGTMLSWLIPGVTSKQLAIGVGITCLAVVVFGHYRWVDAVSKWIVASLALVTLIAASLALGQDSVASQQLDFVSPSPWTLASLAFLVSFMGWMPAPVEVVAMNTVWNRERAKLCGGQLNPKHCLTDLNMGYITTAILAVIFLVLGAQVLHGSDQALAKSSAAFAQQFADMYATVIGDWSRWLVILAAVLCIYSSTLSCVDGYSRVSKACIDNLKSQKDSEDTQSLGWILSMSLGSLAIVLFFAGSLMAMLKFAMIAAFLTTPIFALLNFRLMHKNLLPEEAKPAAWLNALAIAGLIFLYGFAVLFIWWQWLA